MEMRAIDGRRGAAREKERGREKEAGNFPEEGE